MYDDYGIFYNGGFLPSTIQPKPSLITGEGRMRSRGSYWKDKKPDLKKSKHRKMAKNSKRANRRK